MNPLKRAASRMWEKLNPADPSPHYLIAFMSIAILVFAAGLAIGALAS